MHSYRMLLIILMTAFFAATNAYSYETINFGTYTSDEFQNYWYSQGAEISRFKLQQSRYGEIHDGDAVLVFVTEELNRAIQVKADRPGQQNVPVLKLNAVRKFFTGIYPYSIMTSIFAPINAREYPLPLKITSSTQEWCGQVYTQMNLGDGEYRVRSHSYFEEEGDQNFNLKKHVPEDAIWTMIRLAPQNLPRGDFFMIPGTVYSRLMHRALTPQKRHLKPNLNGTGGPGLRAAHGMYAPAFRSSRRSFSDRGNQAMVWMPKKIKKLMRMLLRLCQLL